MSSKKNTTFAASNDIDRNVAQLVAHYVLYVGVGRSSRLIPTRERKLIQVSFRFIFLDNRTHAILLVCRAKELCQKS